MGVMLGLLLVPSPPLAHVALWGSLLWCHLCLPSIIHIVVVGVLLGVGHTVVLLIETSLVFLKLKEKKFTSDQEVTSPDPVGWSPMSLLSLPLSH